MDRKLAFVGVVVLALCIVTAYWLWSSPGQVSSVNAVVEGRLATISMSVPGVVKDLYVNVGDMVKRDQSLLLLDPSEYEKQLAKERSRLAEVAVQLPPGLRVTSPNSRSVSPDKSLEALRDEEEEARKKVETAAHVYAASNLAFSRMSLGRPGEYAGTNPSRQAALIARDEAGSALKKARDAYERVSYTRAQREVQDRIAKNGDPISAGLAVRIAEYEAQISRVWIAEQNLAATVLTAPENGRVTLLNVRRGSQVTPGDAPVIILPEDGQDLYIMAFFSPEDAALIAAGQECEIQLAKGGKPFKGIVDHLSDMGNTEKKVAQRVILDQNTLPANLALGQTVSVTVITGGTGIVGKALDLFSSKKQ